MAVFRSPWGFIELTEERRRHIIRFHPEVARYLKYIPLALSRPEKVLPSLHNPAVTICYHFLKHRRLYLAIVMEIGGAHQFILTAYITYKPKRV